jgi:hypothetical protein
MRACHATRLGLHGARARHQHARLPRHAFDLIANVDRAALAAPQPRERCAQRATQQRDGVRVDLGSRQLRRRDEGG